MHSNPEFVVFSSMFKVSKVPSMFPPLEVIPVTNIKSIKSDIKWCRKKMDGEKTRHCRDKGWCVSRFDSEIDVRFNALFNHIQRDFDDHYAWKSKIVAPKLENHPWKSKLRVWKGKSSSKHICLRGYIELKGCTGMVHLLKVKFQISFFLLCLIVASDLLHEDPRQEWLYLLQGASTNGFLYPEDVVNEESPELFGQITRWTRWFILLGWLFSVHQLHHPLSAEHNWWLDGFESSPVFCCFSWKHPWKLTAGQPKSWALEKVILIKSYKYIAMFGINSLKFLDV